MLKYALSKLCIAEYSFHGFEEYFMNFLHTSIHYDMAFVTCMSHEAFEFKGIWRIPNCSSSSRKLICLRIENRRNWDEAQKNVVQKFHKYDGNNGMFDNRTLFGKLTQGRDRRWNQIKSIRRFYMDKLKKKWWEIAKKSAKSDVIEKYQISCNFFSYSNHGSVV